MEKTTDTRQQMGMLLLEKSEEERDKLMYNGAVLMTYYRCAVLEIETKFKVLDAQFSLSHERNPIESIQTRIKTPNSICAKLNRKNLPLCLDSIEENLFDIGGVRVICSYIDDIYMLSECLLQQDDVNLISMKDYIKNPKPNGYRSLHLVVEIPIFLYNEKRMVKVEVQLRTIAMQSWANLEHRMRYKKNVPADIAASVDETLLECAQLSNVLDLKMQQVRTMIAHSTQDNSVF